MGIRVSLSFRLTALQILRPLCQQEKRISLFHPFVVGAAHGLCLEDYAYS